MPDLPTVSMSTHCDVVALAAMTNTDSVLHSEALLAEMGVAMREDGGTVGVFSPKKVSRT